MKKFSMHLSFHVRCHFASTDTAINNKAKELWVIGGNVQPLLPYNQHPSASDLIRQDNYIRDITFEETHLLACSFLSKMHRKW